MLIKIWFYFQLNQFHQAFPWEGIATRWSRQPPHMINITVELKIVVVAIQVMGSCVITIHHRLDFCQHAGYRVEPNSSMTIYSTNLDSFSLSVCLTLKLHEMWNVKFLWFSSFFMLYFKFGFWCCRSWTYFLNSHVIFLSIFFLIF